MLKRLALIGAAVAGVVFLRKKAKQQQAEQDLWTQATDDVQAPGSRDAGSRARRTCSGCRPLTGDDAPASS